MPSNDSKPDNQVESDDIGADIAASIEKLKTADTPKEPEPEATPSPESETEKPETKPTQEPETEKKPEVVAKKYNVPQGYSAIVKEKWDSLPEAVQADLVKREEDFHKMVTSRDGELNLGREMKEVITPYMPIIQAEGGTPVAAVRDLLNTAYVLRTGSQEQKQNVIRTVCQQYGIPMEGITADPEFVDPTISQLQQEIFNLKKMADPETIFNQLQEKQERANIRREADAFARDPANIHFEKVKPFMAAFLGNGDAGDYKEAYDMACQAHPEVRSILEAQKKAADSEKRKAELKAKQNAASSITGSPATTVSNTGNPTDEIENAVRAAMRSASGAI